MPSILKKPPTVEFDPANIEHRSAYVSFLNNGIWTIKFSIEWPFTSVPSLAMFKLATFACADAGSIDQESVLAKSRT